MIKNIAKKTIISKDFKICESNFSKAIGLMFSLKPITLIFVFDKEMINPLHMFFVFFSIDVLFLDKNKMVVDMKQNFMPFTFYTSKKKSKYVIELPKKTIKKSKTKIGDKLVF